MIMYFLYLYNSTIACDACAQVLCGQVSGSEHIIYGIKSKSWCLQCHVNVLWHILTLRIPGIKILTLANMISTCIAYDTNGIANE